MSTRTFPEPMPDIATVAAALADPSRAGMCAALMDGRARTLGELGRYCGLARSTASEHVDLLVGRGLLTETRQGRHRYLRLAGDHIARVIEDLAIVSRSTVPTPRSLGPQAAGERMRAGRTCYGHLAGRLGVDLTERFQQRGLIDDSYQGTAAGRTVFAEWGVADAGTAEGAGCMDSTERRLHLAGQLGTRLCGVLLERGWVERIGTTRAVRLTGAGSTLLH